VTNLGYVTIEKELVIIKTDTGELCSLIKFNSEIMSAKNVLKNKKRSQYE